MKRIHEGAQSALYPQEYFLGGLAAVGAQLVEELRAGWYKVLQAVLREFGRVADAGKPLVTVTRTKNTDSIECESKDEGDDGNEQGISSIPSTYDPSLLCKIALWLCSFREHDIAFLNECKVVKNLHDIIKKSDYMNVSLLAWNVLKMLTLTAIDALRNVENNRVQRGIYKLLGDTIDVFGAVVDDNISLLAKEARDLLKEKNDFAVGLHQVQKGVLGRQCAHHSLSHPLPLA